MLSEFLAAQERAFQANCELPAYREQVPVLDDLYERAIGIVQERLPRRLLRLAHKCALSGIVLALRGLPGESAAPTRRACEIGRFAIVVGLDVAKFDEWSAIEKRVARWEARIEGRRPKHLSLDLKAPSNHEIGQALEAEIGRLSDAWVHFTPEYVHNEHWCAGGEEDPPELQMEYVAKSQKDIEQVLGLLVAYHVFVLLAIDMSFAEGRLRGNAEWIRRFRQLHAAGAEWARKVAGIQIPPLEDASR